MRTVEPITLRWEVVKGFGGWGVWQTLQSGDRVERACIYRASNHADAHAAAFEVADQRGHLAQLRAAIALSERRPR